MEAAFEEDASAKVIEIAELKTANEDLQDALDIVSKEAAKVKYDWHFLLLIGQLVCLTEYLIPM